MLKKQQHQLCLLLMLFCWQRFTIAQEATTEEVCIDCPYDGNYDTSLCQDTDGCNPVDQKSAINLIFNETNNYQQLEMLASSNDYIVLDNGGAVTVFQLSEISASLQIFCLQGTWTAIINGVEIPYERMVISSDAPITTPTTSGTTTTACSPNYACPASVNYNSGICDKVLQADPTLASCQGITDTSTYFSVKNNGPCKEQTITFSSKYVMTALFEPNGTSYHTNFNSSYLVKKVFCINGSWVFYQSNGKYYVSINEWILFVTNGSNPVTRPTTIIVSTTSPNCPNGYNKCSSNLNYNPGLCPNVAALYTEYATSCNPVTDTSKLFSIKENGPCDAQTVTMLATNNATLRVAVFLPNGTTFNTPFPPKYIATGKVNCANNTWFFYSNGNYEIKQLMFIAT